jgi:membrane protease YdiL (CAAX protease family)
MPLNMLRHPENFGPPTLANLCLALMAGFGEETAFRGLPLSYLMRQWKDERKIPFALLLTSVLFSLVHLGNIFGGANLTITVLQLISSLCAGLFFGAVYLRSGSLWPTIVLHTLHDIVSLLDVSSISGGVMTGNLRLVDLLDLLLSVILGGIGLWLIRPAKRGEILAVWREKWQPLPDTKM